MKRLVASAVFVSLIALASEVYAFDPDKSIVPKQTVKKYTKTAYSITEKFGEYYRIPSAKYVHIFDDKGLESETQELTPKDALVDKIVYTYDDTGKVVEANYSNAEGGLGWKVTTTYNDSLKTEECELDKDGNLTGKRIYRYTDNTIDESYYNGDGTLLWKNITDKDSTGKDIKTRQYLATGTLDSTVVPIYDDEGRIAGNERYNFQGELSEKLVYRFDTDGLIAEEITYNGTNVILQRKLWKYDENKNPIRLTTYRVGERFGNVVNELISIVEYTYGDGAAAAQ